MKEHLIFRELLAAQGIEHTPEEAKKIFELLDRIFGQKSEIIRSPLNYYQCLESVELPV